MSSIHIGSAETLLRVEGLTKVFHTSAGDVRALSDVSFDVRRGSLMGLVGESGSGKTTLGRCLLRLIEPTAGKVVFDGVDITRLDARSLKAMRKRMQIIFQDPFSSFNPRMRIRQIIGEALIAHGIGRSPRERDDIAAGLLEEVGLSADHLSRYPHEFSGGQRQRIGIARALAVEPEFLIADESVSALDVSVQAQILNLLQDLRDRRGLTILFIAHDLSVVEYLCDEMVVLYLGRVAETGPSETVYGTPAHPYTRALLSAIPTIDPAHRCGRQILAGDIPSPLSPPSGCVFRTRCPYAIERCGEVVPPLAPVETAGHQAACIRMEELVVSNRSSTVTPVKAVAGAG
ncbi:ABC transporter ATP-binding protein [Paraburkholderia diazotrophica]|uniref:Peptide/nickel transport system ATP-binding protein/oligopeptide transport system ATP-binding protein n=1 Tax=Paraburkholderia diazotrophica TaxID=667676 RepID=A0A1H7EKC0_9BURK|nr:ABC transporter ATP-binding protein [Paraburkholderia diazotrophica]SEK14054.1 peptide/nickel transport system ATP-binding protein/oligopeptide transport system ATP-binding protein [Paraburkholderia diazotrophica]